MTFKIGADHNLDHWPRLHKSALILTHNLLFLTCLTAQTFQNKQLVLLLSSLGPPSLMFEEYPAQLLTK